MRISKKGKLLFVGIVVLGLLCSGILGSIAIERINFEGRSAVDIKLPDENALRLPITEKTSNYLLIEKKSEQVLKEIEKMGIDVKNDYGYYVLVETDKNTQTKLEKSGLAMEKPDYKIEFTVVTFRGKTEVVPENLRTTIGNTQFYLVQFIANPCEEWLNAIGAHAKVYEYYRHYTYLVKASVAEIHTISNFDFVYAVYPYHPYFKIGGNMPEILYKGTGKLDKIRVEIDMEMNLEKVVEIFKNRGYEVVKYFSYPEYNYQYVILKVTTKSQVEWILKQGYVLTISDDPEKKLMNNVAARIVGAAEMRDSWRNGLGISITGSGQTVAIADTGLDTGNPSTVIPDFQGRVKTIYDAAGDGAGDPDNANLGGHGTHVAGSVAASGVMSGANPASHIYGNSFAGMAPEAYIHFESIGTTTGSLSYDSITNMATRSYNDGARVWTNSWGSSGSGYTADSREVDLFIWNHKDFLILFAAGNDGPTGNSLDNECTAKSALAVGATENLRPHVNSQSALLSPSGGASYSMADDPEQLVEFSSRGPTDGGYNKPDICAPGTGIVSTRATTVSDANAAPTWLVPIDSNGDGRYDYMAMQGTSMATPITAGACVLVRDYYNRSESHSNASAALVRATMIGGARPMPGYKYFGIDQGYGRIDIANALIPNPPLSKKYWDWQAVNNGATWERSVYVNTSEAPLRVVLSWSDYPSATNSNGNVINNLNLRVIAPNGTEYHGNIFNTGLWYDTQWSQANPASYDTVHANEVVNVEKPAIGEWRIQVIGASITQNDPDPNAPGSMDQTFAVFALGPFGNENRTRVVVDRYNDNILLDNPYKNFTSGFAQRVLFKGQSTNQTFRVVNWGSAVKTYNIQSEIVPSTATITISFSQSSVTLQPNATAWINAKISTIATTPENIYEIRLKAIESGNSNLMDSVVLKLQVVSSEQLLRHTQVTRSRTFETSAAIATDPTDGSIWIAYFRQNESLTNGVYTSSGNGDNFDLIVAHSTDGGKTWIEYNALPNFDRYFSYNGVNDQTLDWFYWYPSIDVDAGGKVYVAFSTFESLYVVYGDESGWTNSKFEAGYYTASPARYYAVFPEVDVVAKTSGNAIVFYTWRVQTNTQNTAYLKFVYTTNGGSSWTGPTAITTTNNYRQYMVNAVWDGTNHWIFFSFRNTASNADYYLAYYTGNPGSWSTIQTLHGTGSDGYYETRPSAFVDSSGNIWVAWYSDDDGQNRRFNVPEHKIYVRRYSGGSWSSVLKIDATVPGLDINDGMPPAIGEDANNVWVGFLEENSNYTNTLHNENWTHYRYSPKAAIISKSSFTISDYKYIDFAGVPVSHLAGDSYGGNVYFSYSKIPEELNEEIFFATTSTTDNLGPVAYNLLPTNFHTENNSKIFYLNFTSSQQFSIYAHIDDVETGNSAIAAAECFIDTIGASGTGIALLPTDGSFSSPIEEVVCTFNGNNFPAGLHRIYVHGRDAPGNWGPYSFIDIFIPENFTILLYPGKNFISNPLYNPYLDASDLVAQLVAGEEVWLWTGSGYSKYTVGGSSPSFSLPPHYAFWINATSSHPIKLYGFRLHTPVAVSLSAGYNQIGWTSLTNLTTTAWDLTNSTNSAGEIRIVSRWNATAQMTNTTDVFYLAMQKYNFVIEPGRGYWVWVNVATTLRYNP
ncbi:MAG: S8 family serine peptidase [Thermoplasmata archaeon]